MIGAVEERVALDLMGRGVGDRSWGAVGAKHTVVGGKREGRGIALLKIHFPCLFPAVIATEDSIGQISRNPCGIKGQNANSISTPPAAVIVGDGIVGSLS